jgi:hypothetical protein
MCRGLRTGRYMRRLLTILGAALFVAGCPCPGQTSATACPGVTEIKGGLNATQQESPDGQLIACLIDYQEDSAHAYTGVFLVRNGASRLLKSYLDAGPGGSVAWSPDSRKFAITWASANAGSVWSVDIFTASTGIWKTLGTEAGRGLLLQYQCNPKRDKDLISVQWGRWISADEAIVEVSIDPIAALCRRAGLMDPVKFRVRVPSGAVIRREP